MKHAPLVLSAVTPKGPNGGFFSPRSNSVVHKALQKDQYSTLSDNSQFSRTFFRNRESMAELLARKLVQKYVGSDSKQFDRLMAKLEGEKQTLEQAGEDAEVKLTPELVI